MILLSATPYNKAYVDLSAQLRLFVAEDEDIGIRPEALLRKIGETRFTQLHQCGLRTLRAFEKSEEPDDWRNLMRRYLVRRTRGFIQEHYAERDETGRPYLRLEDGRRFPFPTRVPKTVTFPFDAESDDPYPRMYAAAVVDAIDGLRLPRYGLGNYLEPKPTVRPTAAEANTIKNLGRAGGRLIGFSRTNLFKRLESGGPAFLQSVERHIQRNFVFLHALEQGLAVPIGQQDVTDFDTQFADADELDEGIAAVGLRSEDDYRLVAAELYERFAGDWRGRFSWLRADLFRAELGRDLLHDAWTLIGVLERCGRWDPARDRKLLALARLVGEAHADQKVLVFTQYADTARYLADQLQHLGIEHVEGVTAGSTDPTRAGRIDRIGQESPEILCYSFLPADGLEQVLNLRGRLRNRLRENAEVVGTDEAFFEDDEGAPLLANLYNEKAGILDDAEDLGVDPTSEAYQLWKDAIEADPKLRKIVEDLPDVVYATRTHEGSAETPCGALVFIRAPDDNDALAWIDERGTIHSESPIEVLRAALCDPWTPALPR
nr:NgoFVII family restriction endonuclease [Chloroflexia bacterium]